MKSLNIRKLEAGVIITLFLIGGFFLPMSSAFNTSENEIFLDSIDFQTPKTKFYSVVEQKILTDHNEIKDSLKRQMLAQVDWISAINNIKRLGYKTFCEIGPSKILKDLVLKIDMHLKAETTALFPDLALLAKEF